MTYHTVDFPVPFRLLTENHRMDPSQVAGMESHDYPSPQYEQASKVMHFSQSPGGIVRPISTTCPQEWSRCAIGLERSFRTEVRPPSAQHGTERLSERHSEIEVQGPSLPSSEQATGMLNLDQDSPNLPSHGQALGLLDPYQDIPMAEGTMDMPRSTGYFDWGRRIIGLGSPSSPQRRSEYAYVDAVHETDRDALNRTLEVRRVTEQIQRFIYHTIHPPTGLRPCYPVQARHDFYPEAFAAIREISSPQHLHFSTGQIILVTEIFNPDWLSGEYIDTFNLRRTGVSPPNTLDKWRE